MKNKSVFVYSFVLAAILGSTVGCAKKLDDAKMTSEIQSKFSEDSGLSSKPISVMANDGVVTLTGTVDNEAQRETAAKQASSEPGVKTVINNLQVGNAAASVAPVDAAPAQTAPATTASAPADKPDPGSSKKSTKTRSQDDSHMARKSSHESKSDQKSNDQMAANSQPQDNPAQPANPTPVPVAPAPPPAPKKVIIDQGTQLTVRLVDAIDSEKNQTGDTFHATLNAPITSDGEEAIPAGVEITGHLVDVKSASKFAGKSIVVLQVDSLTSGGRTYNVQTDQYRKEGSSRGKNTAEKVGGGAVIGSIIGALAGGGKGAAIGAAAGAGVGGGVQAATKAQQIKLPSETILNFTLQAPVTVVQAQSSDSKRQKLNDQQ